MTTGDAALAVVAGAIATLERKALGQFMLSRPIVVAPLVAALLGDALPGLYVGIPLELFFLGSASYGASTPPHETVAALFAGCLVGSASGVHEPALFAVAVLLALPLAALGRSAEANLERWNEGLVDRAEDWLAKGRPARATRQALVAIAGAALLGASAAALGTLAGPALGQVLVHAGNYIHEGLTIAWSLFVGVSAALALRAIQTPGGPLLSGVAAVTVFAVFGLVDWLR